MSSFSRRKMIAGGAAVVAVAGLTRTALANGDVFFEAEEIPGQTEFVYFGSVKDEDGNYLDGATVTIDVSDPHLTYDAYTNVLGRYRTLDVGRAIVDLGFEIDPSKVTVTVYKRGYAMTRRLDRRPVRAKKGAFEMNFVMAKDKVGVAEKK
ncbi:MAG: carboxypeptidase-like regulatory domain-containing protein [Rhodospirillaceae bacterium]|nr:carboxypeptidase-like regulatory domain-containing protein [Rhodospirillaceae bacterium]